MTEKKIQQESTKATRIANRKQSTQRTTNHKNQQAMQTKCKRGKKVV